MYPQKVNNSLYQSVNDIKAAGFVSTLKSIYINEGVKGFYRGVGIACVQ